MHLLIFKTSTLSNASLVTYFKSISSLCVTALNLTFLIYPLVREKTDSIGLKSGEYTGLKMQGIPSSSSLSCTSSLLWTLRLSMNMHISSKKNFDRNSSMKTLNLLMLIALSNNMICSRPTCCDTAANTAITLCWYYL